MNVKPKDIICHVEDERIKDLMDKRVLCGHTPTNMIYTGTLLSACGTPDHPFEVCHDVDMFSHSYFFTFIAAVKGPEQEYRPFETSIECFAYADRWIEEIDIEDIYYRIVSVHDTCVGIISPINLGVEYIAYNDLFENYRFSDGTPCGVEIAEEE